MAHFEIKNLTFSYPTAPDKKALDNINLTIEKGEYITLCGKSGCGKTTLLRHLKSVLMPHGQRSGEILFEGRSLDEVSHRNQSSQIGYVMQNPDNQIVTDKVWHELAFGLESLGCDQKTIRLRVAEMASYFGIQSWFHKSVTDLSGGQKQLLNLASIMAMQPTVLILDEPTSQLDPIAASDFLNTVRKINLELGTTIIITEHRLEDIFHASNRVVMMDRGRITAVDEPHRIGGKLKADRSDMFAAMPSPMQIYYQATSPVTSDGGDNNYPCPLTVKEGRSWLTQWAKDKTIVQNTIDDDASCDALTDEKNAALQLKEVWFRYEKDLPDVLKGVSFNVPKQSLFAIVGGNGTGKSTTLKTICNIVKPYRGKILIDGKPINKYKSGELFKNNLAMLPQDPQSLFVKKTVYQDLEEMIKGDDEQKRIAIENMAAICEITDLLDAHPYDLSGGEQQRAALAKVLLTEPKILLLDEPTKGLDSFFKITFSGVLKKLIGQGVSIVMVSHDIEFCAKYADYVSMFFDGSIITTNTPNRFFSQNSFYTTAANRMSRHLFKNAVNNEEVVKLMRDAATMCN